MPRLPYEQEQDEGVNTTCIVCGRNIHAASYPPVCQDKNSNCRQEWDIETGFNRWVIEYENIFRSKAPRIYDGQGDFV